MKKKNQWWQLTGLDAFFLSIIVIIFFVVDRDDTMSGFIKACFYSLPVLLVYWIVGRIVQGKSEGPGGV